jgi:hypothetical protein
MAEPNGSLLPNAYDDATSLLGALIDQRVLTLAGAVDADTTTIPVNENVSDIEVPCYLFIGGNHEEIVFAPNKTTSSFINCIRGVRGSTANTHNSTDPVSLMVSGQLFNQFRAAILAGEKYQALVGMDASKSASPVVGQFYFATDTLKVYVCVTAGTWSFVGNLTDHHMLNGLGNDDHTQYHNASRALTWHNSLSGGHVTGGNSHDHKIAGDGTGAGRVNYGLSANRPSVPPSIGYVYYETDTQFFFVGKSTDSSGWVKIVGAPVGAIAAFLEADITNYGGGCPPGWVRYTALDGRLPKGAPAGVTSPLNQGGTSTHTHTYSGVATHTHVIVAYGVGISPVGDHHHGVGVQNSGGSDLSLSTGMNTLQMTTGGGGEHTHTITVPARTTNLTYRSSDNAAGVASASTGSGSTFPAYQEIIWCQKT